MQCPKYWVVSWKYNCTMNMQITIWSYSKTISERFTTKSSNLSHIPNEYRTIISKLVGAKLFQVDKTISINSTLIDHCLKLIDVFSIASLNLTMCLFELIQSQWLNSYRGLAISKLILMPHQSILETSINISLPTMILDQFCLTYILLVMLLSNLVYFLLYLLFNFI